MIEGIPGYISPIFIATTFLTVGVLFYAIRTSAFETIPAKLALFLITFWLVFQAILALGGFYQQADAVPPRIFVFGALPGLLLSAAYLLYFRDNFIHRLPLKILTLLHVIRIPVELVLFWLFQEGQIPEAMTFEGRNLDILSGITAPIVYFLAFRGRRINRTLLIIWNIAALLLLANIVITAIMAFPSPMQSIALDQPNRAVMYFPFVWLPSIVVPIVFFCHIASLWKLAKDKTV